MVFLVNQKMNPLETRKVNADLFVLTYGSLVTQLLRDIEDVDAVNAQLLDERGV